MPRDPFDNSLFVGRDKFLEDIERWANHPNPSHRLWSVVASPGTGKSWLMAAAQDRLRQEMRRCVFWIDLSIELKTGKPKPEMDLANPTNPQPRKEWLKQSIKKARKKERCADLISPFNQETDFEACLDLLVDDLCNQCKPQFAPVLFLDGFDEIGNTDRIWLEVHLLMRFLSRSCTRILLTRRDEYKLENRELRWQEKVQWLDNLDRRAGEGTAQLEKRAQNQNVNLDIQILHDLIPLYQWDHPAINAFLFDRAVANHQNKHEPLLNCDDLKECLEEVVRPSSELTQVAFDSLVELAHLGSDGNLLNEWTDDDLFRVTGRRLENNQGLNQLFEFGIVQEIRGARRKVGDGIRELARAWRRCKNNEVTLQEGKNEH